VRARPVRALALELDDLVGLPKVGPHRKEISFSEVEEA